jgi:hypothetical protein
MITHHEGKPGTVTITIADLTIEQAEQLDAILPAIKIIGERGGEGGRQVWRNSGVKGQVFHVFAKAERAFQQVIEQGQRPNPDHLLDLINYAAFALRLGDDLNGDWPW